MLKSQITKQRVLIVDDMPDNIFILLETLRDEYAILVAKDGERALRLARQEPHPDIILLDIAMPLMDGYEVCRRLKQDPQTSRIPVIFLTARTSLEDEYTGLNLGAVDYIHKPFIPALVKGRIRNCLELKRYQEHLEQMVEERTMELSAALEAAEASSRAKGTFLATMSHELRTPLNSIIGFTDLLYKGGCGELTEEQQEYLGYVLKNSRHLLGLINNILDFSKGEAGRLKLTARLFQAARLFDDPLGIVKEHADSRHVRILINSDDTLPEQIQLDPALFTQMMVNLLANAIKFSPEGGEVLVSTSSFSSGDGKGWLRIAVKDNGAGIPEGELRHIFEPFVQVDDALSRSHEGSGLGLPLARMIAELHGGSVEARSEGVGKGAEFVVMLPLISA